MGDLDGKVWFVTGASTGFGRVLSEQLVARGARVVATARDPAALHALAGRAPERVLVTALDVTRPEQVRASVARAIDRFGAIDVVVNNAGYGFLSAIEEASSEEIRAQFEVNFFGAVAVTQAVLPSMRERRAGMFINVSSIVGVRGMVGSGYYCASKWALEGFSETLAREVEPFGIRVLIVEPGPFRTDFAGRSIAGPSRPIAAYEAVAKVRDTSAARHGTQSGDPARAAATIIDTALQDHPPLRLVLGAMAYRTATEALAARLADTERSRELAPAADFPGSGSAPYLFDPPRGGAAG